MRRLWRPVLYSAARFLSRMPPPMSPGENYSSAIGLLNSLQTNASALEALKAKGPLLNLSSLPEMRDYLQRLGYTPEDLAPLNIIHVAGTKGKGSTSAFCSSILSRASSVPKSSPLKVGLYTSPHLLAVRERIRVNGIPLDADLFAKYFFQVWNRLETTQPSDPLYPPKPMYFRFLTLLSFHVFLQEKVDVLVLEVGLGGEYDATNVIAKPVVCGMTALGFDHMAVLGESIGSIAWHKAGIIKNGVPIVTVPQPAEAMSVIRKRASELGASKLIELNESGILDLVKDQKLGLAGKHQQQNAALAKTLCQLWIETMNKKSPNAIQLTDSDMRLGLQEAKWPGRAQIYNDSKTGIKWYFDGAHTPESIRVCVDWMRDAHSEPRQTTALIFNCTSGRDFHELLKPIADYHNSHPFQLVIFTTNVVSNSQMEDLVNRTVAKDPQLKTQHQMALSWQSRTGGVSDKTVVCGTVQEAIERVEREGLKEVLVTGSLHLIGSTMTCLDMPVA